VEGKVEGGDDGDGDEAGGGGGYDVEDTSRWAA